MRVRVRLIGKGTDAEPWDVNLPNYRLLSLDAARGIALVDIPDADLPDDPRIREYLPQAVLLTDPPLPRMPPTFKARWHDWLDRRYRERDGLYRPPLE